MIHGHCHRITTKYSIVSMKPFKSTPCSHTWVGTLQYPLPQCLGHDLRNMYSQYTFKYRSNFQFGCFLWKHCIQRKPVATFLTRWKTFAMPIWISGGRIPQWGRHWRPEGLTPLWCPCSIEHWLTGKKSCHHPGLAMSLFWGVWNFENLKHHPFRALKRGLSTKFSLIFKRGTWDMFIANLQHHVTVDVFLFPSFSHLSFFSQAFIFVLVPTSVFPTVGPTAAIRVCLQVREVMEAAKSTKKHEQRSRPYWQCDFPDLLTTGSPLVHLNFSFHRVFNMRSLWQIHLLWLWGRMFLLFFFGGGVRGYEVIMVFFFLRSYFFGGLPLDSYEKVK